MNVTEGSLTYEAAHDRYLLQYRIDGRKMKARGKTPSAAYARKAEQVATAKRGPAEPQRGAGTLTAALDDYLAERGRPRPSTLRGYRDAVARFVETVGDKPVADITRGDCRKVLAAMALADYRTSSLGTWRRSMSPIFRWAVDDGRMAANPLTGLRVDGFGARESDAPAYLEDVADITRLTKYLRADLSGPHVAHLLMLYAGLRISEALGLAWDDVDTTARTIVVRQQADGRGGLTEHLKTRSSRRTLTDLPATLMEALDAWRELADPRAVLVCTGKATQRRTLDRTLAPRGVQESLRLACERAGVPRVHCHGLRHTAGSLMYRATADLTAVADFLGHADLQLVTRLYVRRVGRRDAGALVDALLAS